MLNHFAPLLGRFASGGALEFLSTVHPLIEPLLRRGDLADPWRIGETYEKTTVRDLTWTNSVHNHAS